MPWIANRLTLPVDLLHPFSPRGETPGEQVLAGHAIQHEEMAVTRGLHHELAWLAFELTIDQHGRLCGIPVVSVVR